VSFINFIISSIESSISFGKSSFLVHNKYAKAVISFLIGSSSSISILLSPFNTVLTKNNNKVKSKGIKI